MWEIVMITMNELLAIIPATRRDVENWLERMELRTEYEKTVRGRPRNFTKENAIELAALANFVQVRISPSAAAALAHMVVRNARVGKVREWFIGNSSGGGIAVDSLGDDRFRQAGQDNNDLAFTVVNMGEIVRRVDALFAEEKVKA